METATHDSYGLVSALRGWLQTTELKPVKLLETHISWILITQSYAYKLKKPVKFDFLDFTTLEQRRHFCYEELRLNRRLAPTLYLDVVPIAGSLSRPELFGSGEPIEFAVKMRSFSQNRVLSRMLETGEFQSDHLDQLARIIAQFHQTAPRAPANSLWGSSEIIARHAFANFEALKALTGEPEIGARFGRLCKWTIQETQRLTSVFQQRRAAGFVRECHGDLHLGNLIFWNGEVVPFDALEFSAELRWVDVLNEIAFTVMDLEYRGHSNFCRAISQSLSGTYRRLQRHTDLALLPCLSRTRAGAGRRDSRLATEAGFQRILASRGRNTKLPGLG